MQVPFDITASVAQTNYLSYTIQLSDAKSNISCDSNTFDGATCRDRGCSHTFDITTSQCASTDIFVTTFATNMFGDGPPSKSMLGKLSACMFKVARCMVSQLFIVQAGAENSLANIEFDNTRKAFLCNFLKLSRATKSCIVNVKHGNNCGKHFGMFSSDGLGDTVTVEGLNLTGNISDYCFTIIAQSGGTTVAVIVKGMFESPLKGIKCMYGEVQN